MQNNFQRHAVFVVYFQVCTPSIFTSIDQEKMGNACLKKRIQIDEVDVDLLREFITCKLKKCPGIVSVPALIAVFMEYYKERCPYLVDVNDPMLQLILRKLIWILAREQGVCVVGRSTCIHPHTYQHVVGVAFV